MGKWSCQSGDFLKFKRYEVMLSFTRDVLATNPSDPNILDTHILDKQRKLILEKSRLNTQINKYLDQIQISKERGEEDVNALFAKLSELTGYEFTAEERADVLAGKLEKLRETFKEMDLKGTTVFFWDKEKNLPCIGDHMIYGYLKAAAEAIIRAKQSSKKKTDEEKKATRGVAMETISTTQALINQHVRCESRFITFDKDVKRKEDGTSYFFQRSLRAMTAQGPRISLAKSEVVPEGTTISFVLRVNNDSQIDHKVLGELFDNGQQFGIGQWRNAGFGQFTFKLREV